jgi:hypothetical protein
VIQLHITYDSVDIDLQDDGMAVLDGYYPRSRRSVEDRLTDEIAVFAVGTAAEREAANRALNSAFEHARRFAEGASPVYLEYSIDAGTRWRAQVFDGQVSLDSRLHTRWKQGGLKLSVLVEREGAWSGEETQLAISNANGTGNTSGLRVYNDGAGTGSAPAVLDNSLAINGADIAGDVPGETRLEMIYGKSGVDGYNLKYIWIGQSWHSPEDLVQYASVSSGNPISIPSSAIATVAASRSLSADTVNAAAGQMVKGMLRYLNGFSNLDITYQMRLTSGGVVIYEGPRVRTNTQVAIAARDIGSMRIPPIPYSLGNLDDLTLEILASQTSGATLSINLLDFYLMPMDGFRFINLKRRVLTGERVVDDGINGVSYQDNGAGADRLVAATAIGGEIRLYPGKDQRLYFLTHTDHGDTLGASNYLTCKLFYRPRRLGL